MEQSYWLSLGQDFMVRTWLIHGVSSVIWILFFFFCISGRYTGNNYIIGVGVQVLFFEVGWVEKVCSKKLAFTKLKWYHPDILHFKCAARKKRNFELYLLKGPFWWILNPGGFVGIFLFMAYILPHGIWRYYFLSVWDSGVDLLRG